MLNDRGLSHPIDDLLLPEGAARAALRRLFAHMRARWRAYWEWRARRATAELLHHLDDRALHDIGISRGEIDKMVYGCARGSVAAHVRSRGCRRPVGRR